MQDGNALAVSDSEKTAGSREKGLNRVLEILDFLHTTQRAIGIGDLAFDTQMIARHSHREVTASHRLQCLKQFLRRVRFSVAVWLGFGAAPGRWRSRADITHGIPLKQQGAPHLVGAGESLFRTIKSREQSGSKKIPYITVC